jgi:hypothetical protein
VPEVEVNGVRLRDPDVFGIDGDTLSHLEIPIRLTDGSQRAPVFRRTVDRLAELIPGVARETFEGAASLGGWPPLCAVSSSRNHSAKARRSPSPKRPVAGSDGCQVGSITR